MDDAALDEGVQASPVVARELEQELVAFLSPLLEWLDARLDRRLVQTCVSAIVALLEWRNRAHGLLLSELGAYVLDPAHAPGHAKGRCAYNLTRQEVSKGCLPFLRYDVRYGELLQRYTTGQGAMAARHAPEEDRDGAGRTA